MTRNDICTELSRVAEGQAFITCAQLSKAMGIKHSEIVKKEYLSGLEAVNGRYFLVREVADVLKKKCKGGR